MSTNSTDTEPDADPSLGVTDPREFRVPSGEELRQLRIICDISPQEAADAIDVGRNTIWRWEQGEGAPRIDDAAALLELYREQIDGQMQLPST